MLFSYVGIAVYGALRLLTIAVYLATMNARHAGFLFLVYVHSIFIN